MKILVGIDMTGSAKAKKMRRRREEGWIRRLGPKTGARDAEVRKMGVGGTVGKTEGKQQSSRRAQQLIPQQLIPQLKLPKD
ncbi:hypothetical protein V502_07962 [Pseudogymnoascus sp. VKM F-4520 (FW-2644)]|nr:hypothetical protein V502_07962 [Pseudogymnoascus sp. VKM F-4520 (FW-2644)]